MRSLRRWRVSLPLLMLFGNGNEGLLGKTGMVVGVQAADVVGVPEAMITPAPQRVEDSVEARLVRLRQEQEGDPNAIQLLEILATALPQSLRQIAATNIPAVSSILWSEFLDNNRPQWFNELPYDIQSYLIREFGPVTAAPPETATGALPSDVTASVTGSPTSISQSQATSTATSSVQESQSTALGLQSSSRTTLTASSSSQSASSTSRQSSLLTTSASLTTLSTLTTPLTSASGSTIPTPSASADPEAPASSSSGLTSREKIGIGIGVPLGAVALAASVFGCCIFLRRRRKRQIEGSQPPSSPGFIPRFSFQEGRFEPEYYQHRAPLNPRFGQQNQQYGQFVEDTNWDDDEGHDPAHMSTAYHGYMMPPAAAPTPSQANNIARNSTPHSPSDVGASSPTSMLDDHRPMLAPALYHSHSSNRARGRRTSHSSLHSVAELTEPDEVTAESPILGRQHYQQQRRGSRSNGKLPALEPLSIPASASIRRKPVATSPVGETSQNTLPRPTLAAPQMAAGQHSGSSSSALALSNISSYLSSHASSFTASSHSSSFSGNRTRMGNNAGYAYLEDYGPEWYYRTATGGNGYHGYESAGSGPQERSTRSDWPLRNPDGSAGAAQKRTQSPMWDRVYDRV